jgi:hypothetical protein
MARIIGDHNYTQAEAVLEKARAYLKARSMENARTWYLQGAGSVALLALTLCGLLLLMRMIVVKPDWQAFLETIGASLLGGVGALLSIASRAETISIDPIAGARIHRIEGSVRVSVGIVAAFFVALAIKADLLLAIFHSLTHPFLALLVACFVAGASERFASGLIKNMEKSVSITPKNSGGG